MADRVEALLPPQFPGPALPVVHHTVDGDVPSAVFAGDLDKLFLGGEVLRVVRTLHRFRSVSSVHVRDVRVRGAEGALDVDLFQRSRRRPVVRFAHQQSPGAVRPGERTADPSARLPRPAQFCGMCGMCGQPDARRHGLARTPPGRRTVIDTPPRRSQPSCNPVRSGNCPAWARRRPPPSPSTAPATSLARLEGHGVETNDWGSTPRERDA